MDLSPQVAKAYVLATIELLFSLSLSSIYTDTASWVCGSLVPRSLVGRGGGCKFWFAPAVRVAWTLATVTLSQKRCEQDRGGPWRRRSDTVAMRLKTGLE